MPTAWLRQLIRQPLEPIRLTIFWLLAGLVLAEGAAIYSQIPSFGSQVDLGAVQPAEIDEASGLVASRRTPGVLWTHNDSGDKNRIFALNEQGVLLATCFLEGVTARDWEDITTGRGPAEGANYLYVGDIGDNSAKHAACYIYRFIEPAVDLSDRGKIITIQDVETISYHYPNGARDAETLMSDPVSGDLFIVSKRDSANKVYCLPFPQLAGTELTAAYLCTLPLTYAVAGDISPTGAEIMIKNYAELFYWQRTPLQTISEALLKSPARLPYEVEPQGEAVCWKWDGGGYYTLSEENLGIAAHLYFYPRVIAAVRADSAQNRKSLHFLPALPNPFNGTTEFTFATAESADITLTVYNEIGERIALLFQQRVQPGTYRVPWRAESLGSGFYLCRLQASGQLLTQKVQLIR